MTSAYHTYTVTNATRHQHIIRQLATNYKDGFDPVARQKMIHGFHAKSKQGNVWFYK